ncbi:MAG: hypothetical protein ACJ72N_06880 [Labedaea sp.]
MTRATTRVPAGTLALITAWRNAILTLADPAVEVYDGAPSVPLAEIPDDAVIVFGSIGEQMAVSGTRTGPNGLLPHDEETFAISFAISSVRDLGDTALARARVAEILGALETLLTADMKLGGAVNRARLGPTFAWDVRKTGRGEGEAIEVAYRGSVEIKALL